MFRHSSSSSQSTAALLPSTPVAAAAMLGAAPSPAIKTTASLPLVDKLNRCVANEFHSQNRRGIRST